MPQTNTPDTPLPHRDTLQQLLRDVNDLRRSHKDQLGPARKYRVHTIQDLLDAMTTETARALIKEYHYGETEKVFFLTEGQLRTVRALDPEQEVAPSLEKLQGLALLQGCCYTINNILNALQQLPETDHNGALDWTQWLMNTCYQRRGLIRPQDLEKPEEQVARQLAGPIRRAGQHLFIAWPTLDDIARNITTSQEEHQPVPTSEIIRRQVLMGSRLRSFLFTTVDAPAPTQGSYIVLELEQAGYRVRPDAGETSNDPALIREAVSQGDLSSLRISHLAKYWYLEDGNQDPELGHQPRSHSVTSYPEPELNLIQQTALTPPDPTSFTSQPNDLAIQYLAWTNGTTPQDMASYLAGNAQDWRPNPELPPCPRHQDCQATCAANRNAANPERHLPISPNGFYQTCRYLRFLQSYGQLNPDQRRQAAEAQINAVHKAPIQATDNQLQPASYRSKPSPEQEETREQAIPPTSPQLALLDL